MDAGVRGWPSRWRRNAAPTARRTRIHRPPSKLFSSRQAYFPWSQPIRLNINIAQINLPGMKRRLLVAASVFLISAAVTGGVSWVLRNHTSSEERRLLAEGYAKRLESGKYEWVMTAEGRLILGDPEKQNALLAESEQLQSEGLELGSERLAVADWIGWPAKGAAQIGGLLLLIGLLWPPAKKSNPEQVPVNPPRLN